MATRRGCCATLFLVLACILECLGLADSPRVSVKDVLAAADVTEGPPHCRKALLEDNDAAPAADQDDAAAPVIAPTPTQPMPIPAGHRAAVVEHFPGPIPPALRSSRSSCSYCVAENKICNACQDQQALDNDRWRTKTTALAPALDLHIDADEDLIFA